MAEQPSQKGQSSQKRAAGQDAEEATVPLGSQYDTHDCREDASRSPHSHSSQPRVEQASIQKHDFSESSTDAEVRVTFVGAVDDTDSIIGQVIDSRYRIDTKIGEGGMGNVYRAERIEHGRIVAVKVLRREFLYDQEIIARFRREARLGSQLEHPHIVSTLDSGKLDNGSLYLVMPFVRGQSLRHWQRRTHPQGIPWRVACHIGSQLADALSAAHVVGIVHRDLKPDNILLEHGYTVPHIRVLDFGAAKVETSDEFEVETKLQHIAEEITRTGVVVGTYAYMGPEQALGKKVDRRADLYALGLILWEMIAGKPLFASDSPHDTLSQQLDAVPPSVTTVVEDTHLPQELDALITQLLSVVPSQRPHSAVVARDLLRALQNLPPGQTPQSIAPKSPDQHRAARSSLFADDVYAAMLRRPTAAKGADGSRAWVGAVCFVVGMVVGVLISLLI